MKKKATIENYQENYFLNIASDETLKRFSKTNTKDIPNVTEETSTNKATPFLKWVGGKRGIINELKNRLPNDFENYYEAFVGGGALFFEIAPTLKTAYLSDTNIDLVITYSVIKKEPEKLIDLLKIHQLKHSNDYYYQIRAMQHLADPIEIAARMIYLNKTCFNGLYRVNKRGEFNVPVGKYTNPGICQEENILACSKALQNVIIKYLDYTKTKPQKGDFIYFDPPYHPTDETSFTAYSMLGFTEKDQSDLANYCTELHKKGVKVMISNSNTRFIRELYKSNIFKIGIVNAPRMVNCKPGGRNSVEEVLITNY